MRKILLISNSYGVDATRYLYGIARAAGEPIKVMTLYIGGCSLQRHYRNMLSEERAYVCYVNGMATGLPISLKEALLLDEWQEVVMQQCSPLSGDYESYLPYLPELAAYVRKMVPKAKQYLHMTWSFAEGCKRFEMTAFETRAQMIPCVREAYTKAAAEIRADGVVPSMDAMCKLYDVIGEDTYRDGFHCNLGSARYMLGCLWFMFLFGRDVAGNRFRDFDVAVTEDEVLLAQRLAREALLESGYTLQGSEES